MENLKLNLESEKAKPDAKPKVPKIHVVIDQEWVSLIANLLRQHQPELSNVLCLGGYTEPEMLHKAYTQSLILNPLFLSKEKAKKCDQTSRLWIANIQSIGDNVKTYRQLLDNCIAPHNNYGPHLLPVITDNPKEAQAFETFPYEFLIISPVPVPGYKGNMKVRCHNRDYQYFFNCNGSFNYEYEVPEILSNHHVFSTRDHLEKIYVNFNLSSLGKELLNKLNSGGRCEVIPVQYLDTTFKMEEHGKVKVSTSGAVQLSPLMSFALKLIPEAVVYNPVEMRETSMFEASTNPLFPAAIGYAETVKFFESLGLDFPDNKENKARMEHSAETYRHQTIPMIKPTGDQLLAYYKPGYYTAEKDFFITLNNKTKIPAFVKGKAYYLYPVQHSEVIELPESQLLDPTSKEVTSKNMSLHCTYTALSITSELKPKEIKDYNTEHGAGFKVITAEEYELARKIQTADAMGNTNAANELRDRLKAQSSKRLHVTSKDPNLAGVLEVFPPPEVKTLSEAYPDKLKSRISTLQKMGAKLTPIQMLHAALASMKRGVVYTHNVGSGKTRLAAYAAIIAGGKRIAFIAKSKILGEVAKELKDELGMRVVHIHSAACIRRIQEEILQENLAVKKEIEAGRPAEVQPCFYVLSQEFLTIGGLANQTFDPYVIDITEEVPPAMLGGAGVSSKGEKIHTLLCTRENAEKEVKEQILKLRADNVISGKVNRIPMRFHQHVQECPRCMEAAAQKLFNIQKRKRWIDLTPATRKAIREQILDYVKRGKIEAGMREFGTFSKHGHCRVCGYLARSYRRIQDIETEVTEDLTELLDALGEEEKSTEKGQKIERGFRSALQFPAYRLLKSLFDTKICDEAHSLTGNSLVYDAVGSIHTERTYLLSGTLLRRTPAEMWQVFTLLWGFRSPEFPYGYEHQTEFIDQHVTYRVTRETVTKGTSKPTTRRKTEEMPEPANAPKLWKFLHQAQLHATSRSMGLKIPDIERHFLEIPLDGQNLTDYDAKLIELRTSYVNRPAVFSLQSRADWFTRVNELQTVALQAKLGKLIPIIKEYLAQNRSIIVACKQQKTYARLVEIFKDIGLDFVKLDEKKPAQPHMRREWLDENFVKTTTPILLTRTPLINESLNNLVKASAIIVVEAEYVFYPLQQLEGRIARPKQLQSKVDVVYMITRHPEKVSVDEAMLQMALRRNNANVELVSGNVTQRTNEQLVEMAESQKMREMELLNTLMKETKVEKVDYSSEFIAREQEIENAEKSKAIIVVDDKVKQSLAAHIVPTEPVKAAVVVPKTEAVAEPAPKKSRKRAAKVDFVVDGDNLLLPIDLPPPVKRRRTKRDQTLQDLKEAAAALKGTETKQNTKQDEN